MSHCLNQNVFLTFWLDSNTSALHQDSSLGLNPGESRMYPSLSELMGVMRKELQEFNQSGLVLALSSLMGLQLIMDSCLAAPEQCTTRSDPCLNSRWMDLCFLFHQTQPGSPRSEDSTRHLTALKSLLDDVWFVLNLDFNVDFTWVSFASLWCVLYGDHFRGQLDKLL